MVLAPVRSLAALGDRLVVGALDASFTQWVEIWDLATNQLVREWTVSRGTIHVATAADAIATAGENEECVVWNLDGTKRFEHSMKGCVWGVALSRDGARVAFGTETLPEKMSEIGNVLWLSGSSTAVATRKLSQRHNRIYQLD